MSDASEPLTILGIPIETQRRPAMRMTDVCWRMPRVRHVPRRIGRISVTDNLIEDAVVDMSLAEFIADRVRAAIEREPEWCRRHLSKQARRIRMARKRRRGWA